jgi:hypothetical protein
MLNKAFLCIGPMSMPVAIGILLLLVAATCLRRVPSSKVLAVDKLRLDPETLQVEIPQAISSPVPYFGHVLGFVRGGHGYFSSLW